MHVKTPLLATVIVLTSLLAIPLTTHTARATPGNPVDSPANVWAPYGPAPNVAIGGGTGVKNIQFQYYADPSSEFNDFVAGKIDITDWALPKASFGAYDGNPDFTLSPVQGEFGLFGIYFNGASSTWANWGCPWGNSVGHLYDSTCGIEMRQAFMHLVNRGDFAHNNVANPAVGLADDTPPAKGGSTATPHATQCTWDNSVMVNFGTGCYNNWGGNEPGAYTITGSGGTCTPTALGSGPAQLYQNCNAGAGFPITGSPDFCAAALHMINAGVASGMGSNCVLTGVNPGVFSHPLRFAIRITNPRLTLGTQFKNELNNLFGATAVSVIGPAGIGQLGPIVFFDQAGQVDDWDAYTYGYSEGGPFAGDALFSLYHSSFTSVNGPCTGATGGDEPSNPTFLCDTTTDGLLQTQATSATLATYNAATLAAMNRIGQIANDLVSYSPGLRIAALTSVGGLVNAKGFAYNSAINFNLVRKNNAYTPANGIYAFGGGDATTVRYGQASDTSQLNIFNAQTVWEAQLLGEVYDTLYSANPDKPDQIFCWMCNSVDTAFPGGNTQYTIHLRQNLRWHDGTPLDAADVAFSFLALRDLSPVFGGALQGLLLSTKVLSDRQLTITFTGQSILYPVDLETFIIPRHIWQCSGSADCANGAALVAAGGGSQATYTAAGNGIANIDVPSAIKVSTGFDPVTNGALIGSGPFVCKSVFSVDLGTPGTGCIKNADQSRGGQAIPIGGTAFLTAFDDTASSGQVFNQYFRSFNPAWGTGSGAAAESGQFQEFQWADLTGGGQVTLTDLASAGACFGASGATASCDAGHYAHWDVPAFDATPGTIGREVQIVNSHFLDTYVSPYSWSPSSLENIVTYP